jgi:hypothetical protein
VALIVLLGDRVPTPLRVFLTAAVIIDDIVAIGSSRCSTPASSRWLTWSRPER